MVKAKKDLRQQQEKNKDEGVGIERGDKINLLTLHKKSSE